MDPLTLSAIIGGASNLFGGIFGGIGKSKDDAAQRAFEQQMADQQYRQQLQSLGITLGQQDSQFQQTQAQNQAEQGLKTANTAPDRVAWRQNQAIQAAIMPGLRNAQVIAPEGFQQYVPQITGGFRIPEGGFDANTLKFFGDNAMLQGEKDLDTAGGIAAGGKYATPSYGSIYGTPQASGAQSAVESANSNLKVLDQQAAEKRRQQQQDALKPTNTSASNQFLTKRY